MLKDRERAMVRTGRILAAVALVAGLTTGTVGLAQIAHGDEATISANQQRDGKADDQHAIHLQPPLARWAKYRSLPRN